MEVVVTRENDSGAGETDRGDNKGREIVGTVQSEWKGTGSL